jgi:hypothetical protein
MVELTSKRERSYIYSLKGSHSKGANRWCSIMHRAILASKRSDHLSADARTIFVIADNYNKNRNNTNLKFASEVVLRGLYDRFVLLYGFLHHTHFGIDRYHKDHNQTNTRGFSVDLGDFIAKFPSTWSQEGTDPPIASFMDYQYDWVGRYRDHDNDIKVNTRLETGSFACTSFEVARDVTGIARVKYRQTTNHKAPYLGQDQSRVDSSESPPVCADEACKACCVGEPGENTSQPREWEFEEDS